MEISSFFEHKLLNDQGPETAVSFQDRSEELFVPEDDSTALEIHYQASKDADDFVYIQRRQEWSASTVDDAALSLQSTEPDQYKYLLTKSPGWGEARWLQRCKVASHVELEEVIQVGLESEVLNGKTDDCNA